jgi:hypothetical protein
VCLLKDVALVFCESVLAWMQCAQALNDCYACAQLLLISNIVSRATLLLCFDVARFGWVCHGYAVRCALRARLARRRHRVSCLVMYGAECCAS